jgi:hypothetical protein
MDKELQQFYSDVMNICNDVYENDRDAEQDWDGGAGSIGYRMAVSRIEELVRDKYRETLDEGGFTFREVLGGV